MRKRGLGMRLGREDRTLMNEIDAFIKEAPESLLASFAT